MTVFRTWVTAIVFPIHSISRTVVRNVYVYTSRQSPGSFAHFPLFATTFRTSARSTTHTRDDDRRRPSSSSSSPPGDTSAADSVVKNGVKIETPWPDLSRVLNGRSPLVHLCDWSFLWKRICRAFFLKNSEKLTDIYEKKLILQD